ncbi:acylphosphatase [Patescibacteria group bacterium]|jgi:acylphosphatase|nr:acylphosphatase [Patescibacteria group bacterium]
MKQVRVTISGAVQGVFFRAFAQEEAEKLRITGWARNEPSGDVTVVAQGGEAFLKKYIKKLEQGPPLSRVDFVSVTWETPTTETFDHFEVVRE